MESHADTEDDDEVVMDVEDREQPAVNWSALPVIRPRRQARIVTTATQKALADGIAGRTDESPTDTESEFARLPIGEATVYNALKAAVLRRRDAEAEMRSANAAYVEALKAFEGYVAPTIIGLVDDDDTID